MANLKKQQEVQQAEQLFNQNFAAIQKAKAQTGDWEKAYQQVTGQRWPKGQNVEIAGNRGTAKKDDPWWKDTLKVAAPLAGIAAAPFTGGLTAALIGAGGGAVGGGMRGGVKGALLGAGLGAASGYGADKAFGAMGIGGRGGSYVANSVGGAANAATGGGGALSGAAGAAGAANAASPMSFKNLAGLMGIQTGLGALSGALAGDDNAGQRQSFAGTDADPTAWLSGARNLMTDAGAGLRDRMAQSGVRLRGLGDEPGTPAMNAFEAFKALGIGV